MPIGTVRAEDFTNARTPELFMNGPTSGDNNYVRKDSTQEMTSQVQMTAFDKTKLAQMDFVNPPRLQKFLRKIRLLCHKVLRKCAVKESLTHKRLPHFGNFVKYFVSKHASTCRQRS